MFNLSVNKRYAFDLGRFHFVGELKAIHRSPSGNYMLIIEADDMVFYSFDIGMCAFGLDEIKSAQAV